MLLLPLCLTLARPGHENLSGGRRTYGPGPAFNVVTMAGRTQSPPQRELEGTCEFSFLILRFDERGKQEHRSMTSF